MPPKKARLEVDRDRPKPKRKGVDKRTLARDIAIQNAQPPAKVATMDEIKHLRELWD